MEKRFRNFLIKILFLSATACLANADSDWVPQLGTVAFPKIPRLSPNPQRGDVYEIGKELYRALVNFDLEEDEASALSNLPETENEHWRRIRPGSFLRPKHFDEDTMCYHGDIYYDDDAEVFYKATFDGRVSPSNQHGQTKMSTAPCGWTILDVNADWMSLLRPEIGDKPLGDVILPGSHDSGTSGIDEDSILVDQNFLFQVGVRLDAQFVANWSLTQAVKLDVQLSSGFRSLDLRVADTDSVDGLFRWYHGMSGDEISEGLAFIGNFARQHPEEILVLTFSQFAAPGTALDPTLPIPPERLDELSDMILSAMGDRMAVSTNFSRNPTMNELLATDRNIMALMDDSYVRAKDPRYWEVIIHNDWESASNPEELFAERSRKLQNFKQFHSHEMTDISGCTTPDEQIVIAALVNVYGDNETIEEIIDEIVPGLFDVNPANMSFEGLWIDLLSKATFGTNTDGMWERPSDLYSNGASVHYGGVNQQARHWLARPQLYKPNSIFADSLHTSDLVQVAIDANSGNIVPEVSLVHQGSPKHGFYQWEDRGFGTTGGEDGVNCTAVEVQYRVTSDNQELASGTFTEQGVLDIPRGLYPPDTLLEVFVRSEGSDWLFLWSDVIQGMIDSNFDVYVRGMDLGQGSGFAYLSDRYDDYGAECDLPPEESTDIVALVEW